MAMDSDYSVYTPSKWKDNKNKQNKISIGNLKLESKNRKQKKTIK